MTHLWPFNKITKTSTICSKLYVGEFITNLNYFFVCQIKRVSSCITKTETKSELMSSEGDMELCGVVVISEALCDVCVFHATAFGEMKLFAVLWYRV